MIRLAWLAVVALDALGAFVVATTAPTMPDPVASRFGAGGAAAGMMARDDYRTLMILLVLFVPGALLVAARARPVRAGRPIRVGLRTLDPAHAAAAARLLQSYLVIVAALTAVFLVALHLMIVEAHRAAPPLLDMTLFYAVTGVYAVLLLGATWLLGARLRRWAAGPRDTG